MKEKKPTYEELLKRNEELQNEVDILHARLRKYVKQERGEIYEYDDDWHDILDSATTEGIFITENGHVIEGNLTGCRMFGIPFDEMKGFRSTDAFDDKSKSIIEEKVRSKYTGFYKVTAKRKDGSTFPAEIHGRNIIYKGREVRLAIVRDITERVKAENIIHDREVKFKTLFKNAADGIILGDETAHITDLNTSMCKMTGYTKEELIGKFITEIFSESSLKKKPFQFDKIREVHSIKSERELVAKDGRIIPIEMNTTLVEDKFFLTIIRDMTERKRVEKALIEKNKELMLAKKKAEESDQLKSEFLANMSHEIRTPMNGILGFARMLKEDDADKDQKRLYLDIIENSSEQLMRIIDDILEISILETKQVKVIKQPVNLNNMFLEMFTIYDKQAKLNKTPLYLKCELDDGSSTVYADDIKLRKIISILIDNSLRYTNKGFIETGYKLKDDFIEIYVKDTGIGIAKEKQEIIFERFSQEEKRLSREYGGLGLGLSIAKENVELMGGKIWVESEKGKGSTFCFTIPYSPVNVVGKKKDDSIEKVILIAEDEEVNYMFLETIIRKSNKNIRILHARNGEEAVDICRKNANLDLVLMDIKMPKMNGLEAARLIKEISPDMKIIAQTAYSTFDDRQKAKLAGCIGFIEKPIDVDKFNSMINSTLYPEAAEN